MKPEDVALDEGLAGLLARLRTFLDEAEDALLRMEPDWIAQAAPRWTLLARELRMVHDADWPAPAVRVAVLGQLASRTAALQQAVGRAQVRNQRELGALLGTESDRARGKVDPSTGQSHLDMLRPVYDAGGARAAVVRAPGTYA